MSEAYQPKLLVISGPYVNAWNGDANTQRYTFKLRSSRAKTWEREYTRDDSHFCLYTIPGETHLPRLAMSALSALPENKQPMVNWVAIDWDTPGHKPWKSEKQQAKLLRRLIDGMPEFDRAGFYFTKAGFRVLWPLATGLPVSLYRHFMQQFYDHLEAHDWVIHRDPKQPPKNGGIDLLTDWTRLFRMPRVLRDGKMQDFPLDFSNMRSLKWTPPEPLIADNRKKARKIGDYANTPPDIKSLPDAHEDEYEPLSQYDWALAAKNGEPLAEEGLRNKTMCSAIGAILATYGSVDPTLPYRLLHASILTFEAAGSRCDPAYLWDRCLHFATLQAGQQSLKDRVLGERSEKSYSSLIEETADIIDVPTADVTEYLIIDASPSFYIFNEDTLDYDTPTGRIGILRGLRRGCPTLCPTTTGPRGGNLSLEELLSRYSMPAKQVQLIIGQTGNFFEPHTNTMYEGCAPLRRDLVPIFTPEIQHWLELLGGKHVDRLLDWLATLTDTTAPTCVMYIHSNAGAGKGMLASGLASLWNQPIPTKYENAIEHFNEDLFRCPLVWADEHVSNFDEKGGASKFRQLTGASGSTVNRKYKTSATLKGAPRLLITANNANALRIDEHLTGEDLEAVVQRVGYIRSYGQPARYLESLNGWETTRAWVDKFLIAQHVLWLAANRVVKRSTRFIVPGWPSDLTKDLTTHAGLNGLTLISLIHYILEGAKDPMMPVGDGLVLAHTRTLMKRWTHFTGQKQPPNEQELAMTLKTLSLGKERRYIKGKYVRLWNVDVERLYLTAQKYNIAGQDELLALINVLAPPNLAPVPDLDAENKRKRQKCKNIFDKEAL